jgi:hypothetical protein
MEIDTVKLNITDVCEARCSTCLQHRVKDKKTMSPDMLRHVLEVIGDRCRTLFVNGTGDYLSLPNHQDYSDVIAEKFRAGELPETSITTVCGFEGQPRIWASIIICSFNCVTQETFDRYLHVRGGFARVVENIRLLASTHGAIQIHSLQWKHNPDPDQTLLDLFGDLPCSIRVSEKVENQCLTPVDEDRVPCDYLDGITINADGSLRRCSHDFFSTSLFGHIDDLEAALEQREVVRQEHQRGEFTGICENCNYNIREHGRIYWIK